MLAWIKSAGRLALGMAACAGLLASAEGQSLVLGSDGGSDGAVIDEQRLDDSRGGTEITSFNWADLHGSVKDNSAVDVVTGSNSISEGSFANLNGIPTVIQNTGANVLIQNATVLTVQFK